MRSERGPLRPLEDLAPGIPTSPPAGRRSLAPIETLRAARLLIEDPARWWRSPPARLSSGHPCASTNPGAVRWCAAGAIGKITGRRGAAPGFRELDPAAQTLFGEGIGRLNDRRETTHDMMLRCFDRALADLGASERTGWPG